MAPGDETSAERDLYRALLELANQSEVKPLLMRSLDLVVRLAGAQRGYLKIRNPYQEGSAEIALAHGGEDIAVYERAISTGVIQRALASGCTVVTASAQEDERFRDRESVRNEKIEAVLCAPIGAEPPLGVLYLQGRDQAGPFGEHDRMRVELCATQISLLADRLLLRGALTSDPTATWRERLDADDVVGRSRAMAVVLEEIALVAPLEVSVLLRGPTGTGKSHLARVIHRNSARAAGPFVELNCATLPEALVESELFGAEKGAHSTASQARHGHVAAAEGGTLFLDEIGELSLLTQAKLLQLLQAKTYFPLGANQVRRADVRIIAATHQDLEVAIETQRFREDLYYRLNVLTVRVPSLAERAEDIPELAAYQLRAACRRHGLPEVDLSGRARRAIETSPWPGNIRQLFHTLESAVIRAAGGGSPVVEPKHLGLDGTRATDDPETFQSATRQFQAALVRRTLEATMWNVTEAAAQLDVARSYLYKLIQAHGLSREG